MAGLMPDPGSLLHAAGAFLAAFGAVVAAHECGHYAVGRLCGIKAEAFSLGFGPELWSRRDRHGTLWRVAALPLGGYVRFAGGGDAEGSGGRSAPGLRHTLDGAPLWARAATVAAGPAFSFALSVLAFAAVAMVTGTASDPLTVERVGAAYVSGAELRRGDVIVAVDGRDVPGADGLAAFIAGLPAEPYLEYTVRRGGRHVTAAAPHPFPPAVAGVAPGSAAEEAGLLEGDVVLSVNGGEVWTFAQLREAVGRSGGAPLDLTVRRAGGTLGVRLTPRMTDVPLADGTFGTRRLIGVTGGPLFEPRTEFPGIGPALGSGVRETADIVRLSLSGLYHIAAGLIGSCSLSGPIGIAEAGAAAAGRGWASFVQFIAVLSAAVGLINLFPVPVLDGGHLAFHAWEAVSGKRPGERARGALSAAGLALILALTAFAVLNDILCP